MNPQIIWTLNTIREPDAHAADPLLDQRSLRLDHDTMVCANERVERKEDRLPG